MARRNRNDWSETDEAVTCILEEVYRYMHALDSLRDQWQNTDPYYLYVRRVINEQYGRVFRDFQEYCEADEVRSVLAASSSRALSRRVQYALQQPSVVNNLAGRARFLR